MTLYSRSIQHCLSKHHHHHHYHQQLLLKKNTLPLLMYEQGDLGTAKLVSQLKRSNVAPARSTSRKGKRTSSVSSDEHTPLLSDAEAEMVSPTESGVVGSLLWVAPEV